MCVRVTVMWDFHDNVTPVINRYCGVTCLSPPLWMQSFMYGDYIAYDFWLGKVYDLTNHIILKLSNGAR